MASTRDILPTDLALTTRRSVRGYLPKPVPKALLEHILHIAAWAPSGTSVQPWHVIALTGEPCNDLPVA